MRYFTQIILTLLLVFNGTLAFAMEVQGFIAKDCAQHIGLIIHVDNTGVDFLNTGGQLKRILKTDIETLLIYNVIDNPIRIDSLDANSVRYLKSVYFEDDENSQVYAFPIQFIDNLLIFYSLDGKVHVRTYEDIYKLRPAPESLIGTKPISNSKSLSFEFAEAANCPALKAKSGGVKPTRILADKISIDEFLSSFEQGYQRIESFEERTYLYAKPFLYPKKSRLGLVFSTQREEPSINAPFYFQWSSGEAYRFQSMTVIGQKSNEFTANVEPQFNIRSEVKSHIFHGLFIGNIAGMAAGSAVFMGKDILKISESTPVTVQPSFNYMALMGGDYGPWSVSGGLYFPTYGIKVGKQYREVLGSSASYALRVMFTKEKMRFRVMGSYTNYNKGTATKDDVLAADTGSQNPSTLANPDNYSFNSVFARGGVDYQMNSRLSAGLDGILLNGKYKESFQTVSGNVNFNKLTIQGYVQRAFGEYVSITGFMNVIQNNYEGNLGGIDASRKQNEVLFFGSLEFIL